MKPAAPGAALATQLGRKVVPTYILLANWTEQGARQVKDAPKRVDTAKKALKDVGGDFKSRRQRRDRRCAGRAR